MITRRQFATLLGAAPWLSSKTLELEAIVGPEIPHRLVVKAPYSPLYERRVYRSRIDLSPVFASNGIHALRAEDGSYLIPFESLEAREKAWQRFGRTPAWIKIRYQAALTHLSIYRPVV